MLTVTCMATALPSTEVALGPWVMQPRTAAGAARWFQRWRMFWMACAELFGYDNGNEWMVAHYRFKR